MKKVVVACVALLGSLGLTGPARADDVTEYQAFALQNLTGRALTYQVRWGSGRWTNHVLAPGATLRHFMPDYLDAPAPAPQVRFASAPGAPVLQTFNPVPNRVQDRRDAALYYFQSDAGGNVWLSSR